MPEPTVEERVRELHEVEEHYKRGSLPNGDVCLFDHYAEVAGRHMPAILEAYERQREELKAARAVIEAIRDEVDISSFESCAVAYDAYLSKYSESGKE